MWPSDTNVQKKVFLGAYTRSSTCRSVVTIRPWAGGVEFKWEQDVPTNPGPLLSGPLRPYLPPHPSAEIWNVAGARRLFVKMN